MRSRWSYFGVGTEFKTDSSSLTGLAAKVLAAFNIPQAPHDSQGGTLRGVDIKQMSADAVISASLLELMKDSSKPYELVTTANGCIKIKNIGHNSANIYDVYYTMQGVSYQGTQDYGVMVTGGKPHPKRKMKPWTNMLGFNSKIWSDSHYLKSKCTQPGFSEYCTITYDDPNLSSSYDDGIDNLYNVKDPFESVIGYAYDVSCNGATGRTGITFSNQSIVPLNAGSELGNLLIPTVSDPSQYEVNCPRGLEDFGTGSISINVPSSISTTTKRGVRFSNFLGVRDVIIVGREFEYSVAPIDIMAALEPPSLENAVLNGEFKDTVADVFVLEKGKHYGVKYTGQTIEIALVERTPYSYAGLSLFGDDKSIYVRGDVTNLIGLTIIHGVSIFPVDIGKAIKVDQILVSIVIDKPSIEIYDPDGNALSIAESLSVNVAAITMTSEPAPIAINGKPVDLRDGVADHDPTSKQSLSETSFERDLETSMSHGGFTVTLSCLSDGETLSLSSNIKSLYSDDSGVSSVTVCGPGVGYLEIGDSGSSGGVINSIEYRYNDSSSYTVSVEEGSITSGLKLGSLSGGAYVKQVETVSAKGIVLQDEGSNGMFKVLIDGVGTRSAINGACAVIRTGDRVNVSIHNNPME